MATSFDPDLLRSFVAAAEKGSFTAAGQFVHRSQSAVSMQVQKLEGLVGKQLFKRDTRNLHITPAGEVMLDYARQMLALQDEAWAAVARPDVTGHIVVGAPDNYIGTLVTPVMRQFSLIYPRVELEVVCAPSVQLAAQVQSGTVDLALASKVPSMSGEFVRHEPIEWVGAVGTQVWKERPVRVALYDLGSPGRAHVTAALTQARIRYRSRYSSPSLAGLLAMVDADLAISALARCGIPDRLQRLGAAEGLPVVRPLEVILARSADSNRRPCDYFSEQVLRLLKSDKR